MPFSCVFFLLVDQLNLVFNGRQLSNEDLLSRYGIRHMSAIVSMMSLRGGGIVFQSRAHGMGDATGRNASKEQLYGFDDPGMEEPAASSGSSSPSIGAKSKNH